MALDVGTAFAIGNGVVATASDATATGAPSDTSEFSITRFATELRPWHNTIMALDVNNSRTIEPLDSEGT